MLPSYNRNKGKATIIIVNGSAVGVTTAATIRIITAEYLLLERIKAGVIMPNFDNMYMITGNWKIIPEPSVNVMIDER